MTISKKYIIVFGIVIIWLFALLNRIDVYCTSEIVLAKSFQSEHITALIFRYNGVMYQKIIENNILSEDDTNCKVLIKRKNPNNFIVLNFWDFAFGVIIVSIFVSFVWLLFAHSFFEDIETFQLLFHKDDEK
jgi:hypothetical protein